MKSHVALTTLLVAIIPFFTSTFASGQGALQNGGVHSGAISVPDEVDEWTISVGAGDWIGIRIELLGNPDWFTPRMDLYDANGEYVRRGGWNTLSPEISHRAETSGSLSIRVSDGSSPGGHVGEYALRMLRIPGGFEITDGDDGGPLRNGPNQSGMITPADLDPWTFHADAGDALLLRISLGSTEDGFIPVARLFDPDGAYVDQAPWNSLEHDLLRTAGKTGTYTVVVSDNSSYGRGTGDYLLRLLRIPGGFEIPSGDDGGTLLNGADHHGTIDPGDLDPWTFDAVEGDSLFLRMAMESGENGFAPALQLFDPDGAYVDHAPWNSLSHDLFRKARKTGTYTAVALDNSNYGRGRGNYTMRLARVPGAFTVEDDGGTLETDVTHHGITDAGDLDLWTCELEAGDTMRVVLASTQGTDAYSATVWILGPDGSFLRQTGAGNAPDGISFRVDSGGTYTVVVADGSFYGVGSGSYSLFFARIRSPLIFIPGIAGSVLELGGLNLWPTINPLQIRGLDLELDVPGIRAVDVLRRFEAGIGDFGEDVYGPLIDYLTQQDGYVEFPSAGAPERMTSDYMLTTGFARKPSLFLFPYDWRRSNASQADILDQYVANIRQLHGGAPVRFLVHSMGGLVLRRYLLEKGQSHVEKAAVIATPYWGAPVATYRVLRGDFFPTPLYPVNWINNDSIKRALASFPGFHELLPSETYFANGGFPVFSEAGRDMNNNGEMFESYSLPEFHALMDRVVQGRGVDQFASGNSQDFHAYRNGRQDDSSEDAGSIGYLHVVGLQDRAKTTVEVVATSRTHFSLNEMKRVLLYVERKGPGDGTVPLLSARRLEAFHPPVSTTVTVSGGDEADHNGLTKNPDVWRTVSGFFAGEDVSSGVTGADSRGVNAQSAGAGIARTITVLGTGYVKVTNASGDENVRLSEMAALRVPGVDIRYGGDEPWVRIGYDPGTELLVEGPGGRAAVDVEIIDHDEAGVAVRLERYRFSPDGGAWRLELPDGHDPELRVDRDLDGVFIVNEIEAAPYLAFDGTPIDTVPPSVTMLLTLTGDGTEVTLIGADDVVENPVVRFRMDDQPVREYSEPLVFPAGVPVTLGAFAEDFTGNTSGMISTTINPVLSIGSDEGTLVGIEWPASDGYVLERRPMSGGSWSAVETAPDDPDLIRTVTLPVAKGDAVMFRLRFNQVIR